MKLGVIGLGNMGKAILNGAIEKGVITRGSIYGYDILGRACEAAKEELDINISPDAQTLIKTVDVVLLAIKPQQLEEMLAGIKDWNNVVIISIVAGKSIEWLAERIDSKAKIVRCMPNTPALVGEGVTGVCANEYVSDDDLRDAMSIIEACGMTIYVKESQMDAVVAVSGSSPAYVFMFIEALADAAVAAGLTRADAIKFAAKAVSGSADMVLKTGKHPGELKDMVCSPAGTTIEAVKVLEEKGFRGAVIDAALAAAEKSANL